MTANEALSVAQWRYPDQWSVYDLVSAKPVLDELGHYWVVIDTRQDTIVGFFCSGEAARVSGLDEDPSLIDVGVGMDPQLVGQGRGSAFGRTVIEFLSHEHPDRQRRAVVQSWNERSLRLTRRLGFVDAGEVICVQHSQYVRYRVLVK